jgi:hypothetical protein
MAVVLVIDKSLFLNRRQSLRINPLSETKEKEPKQTCFVNTLPNSFKQWE